MDSKSYLDIVQIFFSVITISIIFFYNNTLIHDRRSAARVLVFIFVVLTSVYWVAGPYSFVDVNLELDYPIAFSQAIDLQPPGTLFSHSMVGGHDIHGVGPIGGQFVSFERLLLAAFPLWLAVALHHMTAVGLWLYGSYLLSRRVGGAGRGTSVALALLATTSVQWGSSMTFWLGIPIAIAPLAVYVIVFRYGRRHYYPLVIALSTFHAIAGSQPQGIVGTMAAIGCAAFFVSVARPFRLLPALTIFAGLLFLNWHEAFYALKVLAPHTGRSVEGVLTFEQMPFDLVGELLTTYRDWFLIIAFTIIVHVMTVGWRWGKRLPLAPVVFGFVLYVILPSLMMLIPYEKLGMKFMYSFSFRYLHISFGAVAVLVVATIIGAAEAGKGFRLGRLGLATAAILAMGVGKAAWVKGYELSHWLVLGGVRQAEYPDLRNPEWLPAEPIRVVSLPFRFGDNLLPALGFDSLTSHFSMPMRRLSVYLGATVGMIGPDERYGPRGQAPYTMSLAPAFLPESIAKCCLSYDLVERGVDIDLLRVANVGFIISRLPLTGPGMRKVAGPPDTTIPPRSATPIAEKIATYLNWIVEPPPLFVYAFDNPLPRVFAARKVVTLPDDVRPLEHHRIIAREAVDRAVVVLREDSAGLGEDPGAVTILRSAPVLNGYDMEIQTAGGGIVVLNVAHLPFWRARVDGVETTLAPVNGIHMALRVPPGAARVEIRYERPLLRDHLIGRPAMSR